MQGKVPLPLLFITRMNGRMQWTNGQIADERTNGRPDDRTTGLINIQTDKRPDGM